MHLNLYPRRCALGLKKIHDNINTFSVFSHNRIFDLLDFILEIIPLPPNAIGVRNRGPLALFAIFMHHASLESLVLQGTLSIKSSQLNTNNLTNEI